VASGNYNLARVNTSYNHRKGALVRVHCEVAKEPQRSKKIKEFKKFQKVSFSYPYLGLYITVQFSG
jgi:hypothetical protein